MAKEPTPLPTKTVQAQDGVTRVVPLPKPPPPPAPPPKKLDSQVAVVWQEPPAKRREPAGSEHPEVASQS